MMCIGARVRLRVDVTMGADVVPAGSISEVVAHHVPTRELSVAVTLQGRRLNVRVNETVVDFIERPPSASM
jgi:hypothetical protein